MRTSFQLSGWGTALGAALGWLHLEVWRRLGVSTFRRSSKGSRLGQVANVKRPLRIPDIRNT